MTSEQLTTLDGSALSHTIHARLASCREVMQAYLSRIGRLNPRHRCIVSLADEVSLLAQADQRDAELAAGYSRGWMHGFPMAVKDSGQAVGFPTTMGSPLLARNIAQVDSIFVERMKAAGGIVIGKTNMSEFGLGSHSYNPLFGTVHNAWNADLSAGGSSGGAAVALALRLLPVSDGGDLMGSLRNPAAWNHVFGMRPSQGRVPAWPKSDVWVSQLGTDGPMARTVRDLARLLETQAGYDIRAPLSLGDPQGVRYEPHPEASVRGLRIGWLADLDGHLAMDPGILEVCESALARMELGGARVEPVRLDIDLDQVWQAWLTWRGALVAPTIGTAMAVGGERGKVKPEALWELDRASALSLSDFVDASAVRTKFYGVITELLARYDALALPVTQVWPFDAQLHWPRSVGGRPMDTYHRWMESTLYATFAGLPAISVPAGFDFADRLPMGLQLIGRPRADAALLELAAGYESLVQEMLARRPAE